MKMLMLRNIRTQEFVEVRELVQEASAAAGPIMIDAATQGVTTDYEDMLSDASAFVDLLNFEIVEVEVSLTVVRVVDNLNDVLHDEEEDLDEEDCEESEDD